MSIEVSWMPLDVSNRHLICTMALVQDIAHQLDESCGGGTLHLNRGLYHVPKAG